ncbi:MAG TPA: sodium:alanine symporter family protein [Bdellovibrionales bacterium]|nr:MAG: transporter [Bdellovibrionales bacterium GWB1_52_6]OFZ06435.1 MAG: transporter [Bdellovibrionales bacterium GWA1_52_35]HAR41835.1 sodium:alanine symporter family protein [Bdellovibrionales bacterium]HCM40194.1 sodium:alanine symporter family protein [Bdellovibrionales bacterium]
MDLMNQVNSFVWGLPLIILLVGTGVWLTFALRGLQFTRLAHALYLGLVKRREDTDEPGDISHFQALMTALSATVGTGNIAGVATAIAIGGPGAMFWMWVTGLVGMATKYAEAVLAVKYRQVDANGNMSGGPMYYIEHGMGPKWKWLAIAFAFFATLASFGIGNMVQSNSVASAVEATFSIPTAITGVILALATAAVIIGGIKSIGRVTAVFVPFMIVSYALGALAILLLNLDKIPGAFALIFESAFSPTAATGGFVGAGVMMTIRMGVARGIFSNESGLGSSPIAAAAAKTRHSVAQGLVSMTQTFIDTLVVCSLTGLVLIVTDTWHNGMNGAKLTTAAFSSGLPGEWGGIIVAVGTILFAYSTLIGWSYYGEKAIEYLWGEKVIPYYRGVWVLLAGVGAVLKLDFVWTLSDIFNGLMAFPNLVALLVLSPVIIRETTKYFSKV